jgi:hypothetical protein
MMVFFRALAAGPPPRTELMPRLGCPCPLLNGAADSGRFDHITIAVIERELAAAAVFEYLSRELPATVWEISRLTEFDRHQLSRHWQMLAQAYEPLQFHVCRSGLALLVAYLLHLLDLSHASIPT